LLHRLHRLVDLESERGDVIAVIAFVQVTWDKSVVDDAVVAADAVTTQTRKTPELLHFSHQRGQNCDSWNFLVLAKKILFRQTRNLNYAFN